MRTLKIVGLLLLIIFWAGSSQGQPDNESKSQTPLMAESSLSQSGEERHNLNYIWSITGIEEDGQVIMLLRQENDDLYGQAKFEPDSGQAWNGLAVGIVDQDEVILTLTAQKEDTLCSNRLIGRYDPSSESISGDIFQVCDGNITQRGQFHAIWINPDLTSYTPAVVKSSPPTEPSSVQNKDAALTGDSASPAQPATALPSATDQKSRFHDVREDADRILTGVGDISQIPIGMGGSGLP